MKRSVVVLDHCARLSGGELALLRLAPSFERYRAHVVLAEHGPLVGRLRDAGVEAEVLALDAKTLNTGRQQVGRRLPVRNVANVMSYAIRLARRLRELGPAVVQANSLKSGYYGLVAARLAGVPFVWHVRDRIAVDYMPSAACRLTRAAVRHGAGAVVTNSETTLSTLGAARRSQSRLVLHDAYRPTRQARTSEPSGPFTVGIVGRISPWKGQDVFLRAIALLRDDLPDVRARVIGSPLFGEDEYAREVRQLATALGLDDVVEWRGFRADIEQELSELNVLVHCSTIPEPFGMVVVEGMAAGLPVVASATGGPAEVLVDGVTGLLVPPGEPRALAAAIRKLEDPAVAACFGKAAAQAAARFDPTAAALELECLYDRLAVS